MTAFIYTIQDSFAVLVDDENNIVGIPRDRTRVEYDHLRFEGDYHVVRQVKNAVKLTACVGLKFSDILPPNCTQEEIEETRQLLMEKLRDELKVMIVDTKQSEMLNSS